MILGALLDMTWRIIETSGPQLFITSDNPAVYIRCEGFGLGGKEAELSFALSPQVAVHGSRDRCHPNFARLAVHQKVVRELNKRKVDLATLPTYLHCRYRWRGR